MRSARLLGTGLLCATLVGGCVRPVVRGNSRHSSRVLVIEGLDRSGRGAGMPVADALAGALVSAGIPVAAVIRRPSAVLGPTWLQAKVVQWNCRAAVTATVSGWNLRAWRALAYVAMTGLALAPDGTILWAQRVSASAPWSPPLAASRADPGTLFPGAGQEAASGGRPGPPWTHAQDHGDSGPEIVTDVRAQSAERSQDGERALLVAARKAAKEFAVDLARHLVESR